MKNKKKRLKIAYGIFFLTAFIFLTLTATGCNKEKVIEILPNSEGGYTLYVNRSPFLVRGVIYNPTPIGEGPGYNFFKHRPKPWEAIDGKLMKEMGVNAVRIYTTYDDLEATREFIQDMYQNYGIYTAVSDWLGLWDIPAANYANPDFQKSTKKRVLQIVKELKDEPGVLMWILGNEHNYTFSGKINFWTTPEIEEIERPYERQLKRAEIFYSFVDEIAAEIKKIDPNRPVALSNGEVSYLQVAAEVCSNIDALAIIAYRGMTFGNMFERIRDTFDLPVILSEFGCDSYDAYKQKEDQEIQAKFLIAQWKNIYQNTTLSNNQKGNVLGGFIFEWTDEWWKHNEACQESWWVHNTEASWSEGSYYFDIKAENNLNMNEEWFGIVSIQKEKKAGINKRTPKKAYYRIKNFFQNLECK